MLCDLQKQKRRRRRRRRERSLPGGFPDPPWRFPVGVRVGVRAGFTADEPVWCFFGTTGPIRAEYADEGTVRCKSPAKASNDVPLEVARGNTFDLSRNSVMFSI